MRKFTRKKHKIKRKFVCFLCKMLFYFISWTLKNVRILFLKLTRWNKISSYTKTNKYPLFILFLNLKIFKVYTGNAGQHMICFIPTECRHRWLEPTNVSTSFFLSFDLMTYFVYPRWSIVFCLTGKTSSW